MRRYQELIEAHISRESNKAQTCAANVGGQLEYVNGDSIYPVLNMLNMKYMILPLKDGGKAPILNPWANGNAWFVGSIEYVSNADEELARLGKINTKQTAIANENFKNILGEARADSTASCVLTSYEANKLSYDITSKEGGVVVFSEIYYPGWTCTVDGAETDIARVNYVLRAIRINGGKHKVVLTFDPQSVHTTDTIAYVSLALLLLMMIAAVALPLLKKKRA